MKPISPTITIAGLLGLASVAGSREAQAPARARPPHPSARA
jgi:hypothetical protein